MATEPRPLPSRDRSTIQQAALSTAGPSSVVPLKTDSDIRRIGLVSLSILALIVGVVTGFGAVGFRDLIGLIHNVLFLGKWAVRYDANLFTPASPWGPFVILVPVLGGHRRHFQYADRRRLVRDRADDARGQRPHVFAGCSSHGHRDIHRTGLLWPQPAFIVPHLAPLSVDATSGITLCLYALLGAITGVAAAGFVRGLHLLEDLFDKIKERYTRHILGMLLVGVLMYALQRRFGQYYVEGVGYATVQAILLGQLAGTGLLFLLFLCKLLATTLSLGSGSSGGIFSPSLFMGATIGGAFAAALSALHLPLAVNVPSFAMVGMGAMVGGGTGAVMTAVAMIFEMTRDYDIVLPMILAVAFSVGVRRVLSRENIYTLKLYRRGHVIPKALHANMFLVRPAREVMDTDVVLAPNTTTFDSFLARSDHGGRMRHVVVTEDNHILGVLRVNTALRTVSEGAQSGVTLGDLASRDFTIVREDDIIFDVIQRIWRRRAGMALVVRSRGVRGRETSPA
jgi:H+/Cl- antiporter ClcA